jgi:hypothetical protein
MKQEGKDFIIHGLIVEEVMHILTSYAMTLEVRKVYSKDFDITGVGLIETFLGMQVEPLNGRIHLHHDK